MSPVPMPARVRDLPAAQADMLRRIHDLAGEGARLRGVTPSAPGATSTESLDRLQRLDTVDRDRALLEIRARGNGVPPGWVDVARHLGTTGQPWTDAQVLPPPLRTAVRRGGRIAADTHLLVDMVALGVVREHLHQHHRITTDPDAVASDRYRRNMTTLWQRAVVTAKAAALTDTARDRILTTATTDLARKVHAYRDFSVDDIDTLWRAYATTAFGDKIRDAVSNDPDRHGPGEAGLPSPGQWLEQARTNLDSTGSDPATAITDALAAADADPCQTWQQEIAAHFDDPTEPLRSPDSGPDP